MSTMDPTDAAQQPVGDTPPPVAVVPQLPVSEIGLPPVTETSPPPVPPVVTEPVVSAPLPPVTPEPSALAIGDLLGQYQLVDLIAIGGMGMIYRAYDTVLDRYVAVKVLAPEFARDPEVAQRFLDEAKSAAGLNHLNVVHVYTAGKQNGIVYFVMELVTGQHIEALLAQHGKIPPRDAIGLIRQVALGLQHAHEHGLIHGDVKPANLLIADGGIVKVADFGLVQHVKARGMDTGGSLFGTPGYLSPEVLAGHLPDHRSDMYSLGEVFFQMLTGQLPFGGGSLEETARLQAQGPVPSIQQLNPDVPAALEQIIWRMLAKDPNARYQSYAEFISTLDRYLSKPNKPQPAGLRPRLNGSGGNRKLTATTTSATVTAPPSPQQSLLSVILTILAVIASGFVVYFVYHAHLARRQMTTQNVSLTNNPATAGLDREAQAQREFNELKTAADTLVTNGQLGLASVVYGRWPADRFAGTKASQLLDAEKFQVMEKARQQWQAAQLKIQALRKAEKFDEGIALCKQLSRICEGFPEIPQEIDRTRESLEIAKHEHQVTSEAAVAAAAEEEAAAAAKIRQAKLQQLQAELPGLITGMQWDKGRQVVQAALATAGKDAELRQEVSQWQNKFDCLIALREGMSARLKTTPSAPVTLQTTHGELKGQVSGFDADRITVRQSFGDAGFAEPTVPWRELTVPSICQLFRAGLDAQRPDEVFGYAVFLAEQALIQKTKLDDARNTLQAVASRDAARAPVLQRYLQQLSELEQQKQVVATQQQTEAQAAGLWMQIQTGLAQSQWLKVSDQLESLTNDYSTTAFVKTHALDFQRLTQTLALHILPKGFAPLDIGAACNASFFDHGNRTGTNNWFTRNTLIGDLPETGRVPLRNTEPSGFFQLRTLDKNDAIAITWASGRFPNSVLCKLPVDQQRRYSQLALLTASSSGGATISVRFTYNTGDPEELKFKTFDWSNPNPPDNAKVGLTVAVVKPAAKEPGQMYLNLIATDKQRRLTAITFTWISAGTESPHHCVGIFAVSGVVEQ